MAIVYLGKAFSSNPALGNLAGVVFDPSLSDQQMQEIAAIVGGAETAFVSPSSNGADLRLRWFTPNSEVGMCVHATVATCGVIQLLAQIERPSYVVLKPEMTLETKNTNIKVRVTSDKVMVEVCGYHVLDDVVSIDSLASFLELPSSRLVAPPRLVQIHQDRELVVEVRSLGDLSALTPTVEGYSDLCRTMGVSGLSIFCRETFDSECDLHTREFAPLFGYLEDPLCGTAAGALFETLRSQGDTRASLRVEQGHFAGTSGVIEVVSSDSGVWIGGAFSLAGTTAVG